MKHILITSVEDLNKFDLTKFEVTEDIFIEIKLRLTDQEIEYPINIVHNLPGKESKIQIKLALFGRSKVKMPAEILVEQRAVDTATSFKALVLLMSPKAQATITPGLLIHEKNILSASHGVVIKNIKDKDLVYLQARGMGKSIAREVLVGF
jgi:Fe-S cluster assembly scaffold protein SufB